MRFSRAAALALIVSLAVACSGQTEAVNPEAAADALLTELDANDSDRPLEAVFGFAKNSDEDPLVAGEQAFFGAVQACMRSLGFDYQVPTEFIPVAATDLLGLDEATYAREYGFGKSTRLLEQLESILGTNAGSTDPNAALLDVMSEQEAAAWTQALYGPAVELDFESGKFVDPETGDLVEESPFAGQGCEAQAHEEAFGARAALREELASELDELEERINSAPEVLELNREWNSCMTNAGFAFSSPAAMEAEVDDLVDRFVSDVLGVDASVHPAFWEIPDLSLESLDRNAQVELATLQDYERDLAIVAHACSGSHDADFAAIRASYERDFVGTHAAVIREGLRS